MHAYGEAETDNFRLLTLIAKPETGSYRPSHSKRLKDKEDR